MFWSIYIYDRELVYPKVLDNFIPAWLNHGMVSKVMETLPCIDKSFLSAWLCIHLELIPSEVMNEHCLRAGVTSFLPWVILESLLGWNSGDLNLCLLHPRLVVGISSLLWQGTFPRVMLPWSWQIWIQRGSSTKQKFWLWQILL